MYISNGIIYAMLLNALQVTKDKQWNEIAQLFYQKHDVLNAGYLLKQHYIRYNNYICGMILCTCMYIFMLCIHNVCLKHSSNTKI